MWNFLKKTAGTFATFAMLIIMLGFAVGIVTGIAANQSDDDNPSGDAQPTYNASYAIR